VKALQTVRTFHDLVAMLWSKLGHEEASDPVPAKP
jgi:hypothetical protein